MKKLEEYWNELPVGRENRKTYDELCFKWQMDRRMVRHMLHRLSEFDNGDGYVLIRSANWKGFYKTNDMSEIESYRRETIAKAVSNFAPLKKINRILGEDENQLTINF